MRPRKKEVAATNRKTPTKDSVPRVDAQAEYANLESKLALLNEELRRCEEAHGADPTAYRAEKVCAAEEAVILQEEKIASFLATHPNLQKKVTRPDPLRISEGHLQEQDFRDRLLQEHDKLESELIAQLRIEREKVDQEWRRAERSRLDEQERLLMEAIASRQVKLEDEWNLRRKTESEPKAANWLAEQQQLVRKQLHDGMRQLRQEMDDRERAWREESQQKLDRIESEWREKRRKELQKLEVDWREQEVLHRERNYLRRLEGQWLAEQRIAMTDLLAQMRSELERGQEQQVAAWLDAQTIHLVATRDQLVSRLEQQNREWQANSEDVLVSKLQETQQTYVGSAWDKWRKEQESRLEEYKALVLEKQNAATRTWLERAEVDSRRILEASYVKFTQDLEKKVTTVTEAYCEQWGERTEAKVNDLFIGWSRVFTEQQLQKSSASLAKVKVEWDGAARLFTEQEAERLRGLVDEKIKTSQAQHDIRLGKSYDELNKKIAGAVSQLSGSIKATAEEATNTLAADYKARVHQWESQLAQALAQQKVLWQAQQQELLSNCSTQIMQQVQEQMNVAEKAVRERQAEEIRKLGVEFSKESDRLLRENVRVLRSEFGEQRAEWQQELQMHFQRLSTEYVRQHQQEIEILGQELRGDLEKNLIASADDIAVRCELEVRSTATALQNLFSSELSAQGANMEIQHAENLKSLEAQWHELTAKSIAEALQRLDYLNSAHLQELRESLVGEYRTALVSLAESDTAQRQLDSVGIADAAERKLREQLRMATTELEATHVQNLNGIREELLKEHAAQLSRQYEEWMGVVYQRVEDRAQQLALSFTEKMEQSSKRVEQQCYVEYRSRLGKMVDELTARHREELQKLLIEAPPAKQDTPNAPTPEGGNDSDIERVTAQTNGRRRPRR